MLLQTSKFEGRILTQTHVITPSYWDKAIPQKSNSSPTFYLDFAIYLCHFSNIDKIISPFTS